MKFHEARNALVVDKPEGMNAKPLHRRELRGIARSLMTTSSCESIPG